MMNLSLYEISGKINELLGREEWDDTAVAEVEALNLALEQKAQSIVEYCANLDAFAAAAKAEEQRIAARRESAENRSEQLKAYLKKSMESADRTKIEAGTHKIRIQNNPRSVVVDNEADIPPRFFTVIPESYQLDKKALAADLKKGDVPGAHLSQGTSLRIS